MTSLAWAQAFDYGDEAGARLAVQEIKATGLNIIVFITFDHELDAVLTAAEEGLVTSDK